MTTTCISGTTKWCWHVNNEQARNKQCSMFLLGYLLVRRYVDIVWTLVCSYKRGSATGHIMRGSIDFRELYELIKKNGGSRDTSNQSAGRAIFPVAYMHHPKRTATVSHYTLDCLNGPLNGLRSYWLLRSVYTVTVDYDSHCQGSNCRSTVIA